MDGEAHGESSTQLPGEDAAQSGEALAGSGWTTTKQAAKVLGVSRRSVQGYVRRGLLEAKEEGEGVNKRFLVSIDSLNALGERRRRDAEQAANFAEASPSVPSSAKLATNTGEGLRHAIDRLEARTQEATELRIRLELTERAESTLREELAGERRRREEAEREREDLRRELHVLREARESPETTEEAPDRAEEPRSSTKGPQEGARRSWWRRVLGG
jgi:hypothetical protein